MSKLARLMNLVEYVVIMHIKKIEIEYFNGKAYKIKFNIGDSEPQRLSEFQSFLATIDWLQVEEIEIELYNGQASEIEFLDELVGSREAMGIVDVRAEIGGTGAVETTLSVIGGTGELGVIGATEGMDEAGASSVIGASGANGAAGLSIDPM